MLSLPFTLNDYNSRSFLSHLIPQAGAEACEKRSAAQRTVVAERTAILTETSERLDELKEEVERKGNAAGNTDPVVNIRSALAALREETTQVGSGTTVYTTPCTNVGTNLVTVSRCHFYTSVGIIPGYIILDQTLNSRPTLRPA